MRRNNIEFKETGSRKEIIVHDGDASFTIAWLLSDSDGYYIKTCGDRFTECPDVEDVMLVTKYALRSLQNEFEFSQQS